MPGCSTTHASNGCHGASPVTAGAVHQGLRGEAQGLVHGRRPSSRSADRLRYPRARPASVRADDLAQNDLLDAIQVVRRHVTRQGTSQDTT